MISFLVIVCPSFLQLKQIVLLVPDGLLTNVLTRFLAKVILGSENGCLQSSCRILHDEIGQLGTSVFLKM